MVLGIAIKRNVSDIFPDVDGFLVNRIVQIELDWSTSRLQNTGEKLS